MPLTFRRYKNRQTGEVCHIPTGRYGNFLNSVRKIVNYVRYNYRRYYVVHLILTVAENVPDVSCDHLHRVDTFIQQRLKRAGAEGKRIAVKERQERGAVHFHMLYIYNTSYVFPTAEDIAGSWKLGFVKIRAPRLKMKPNGIVRYIGKYIGKGYEYEALNFRKSFTASQIKQIYKLSPGRLFIVMGQFGKERAENFKCTFRKVYEHSFVKRMEYTVNDWFLDALERTISIKKELMIEFPSEWFYCGLSSGPS